MKFQQKGNGEHYKNMEIMEDTINSNQYQVQNQMSKSLPVYRRTMSAKPIHTSSLTINQSNGDPARSLSSNTILKYDNERLYHSSGATLGHSLLLQPTNSSMNGRVSQLSETNHLLNMKSVNSGVLAPTNHQPWRADQIVICRNNESFLQKYGTAIHRSLRSATLEESPSSASPHINDKPIDSDASQSDEKEEQSSTKAESPLVDDSLGDQTNESIFVEPSTEEEQVVIIKKGILKNNIGYQSSWSAQQDYSRTKPETEKRCSINGRMLPVEHDNHISNKHNSLNHMSHDVPHNSNDSTNFYLPGADSEDLMDSKKKKSVRFMEEDFYSTQLESDFQEHEGNGHSEIQNTLSSIESGSGDGNNEPETLQPMDCQEEKLELTESSSYSPMKARPRSAAPERTSNKPVISMSSYEWLTEEGSKCSNTSDKSHNRYVTHISTHINTSSLQATQQSIESNIPVHSQSFHSADNAITVHNSPSQISYLPPTQPNASRNRQMQRSDEKEGKSSNGVEDINRVDEYLNYVRAYNQNENICNSFANKRLAAVSRQHRKPPLIPVGSLLNSSSSKPIFSSNADSHVDVNVRPVSFSPSDGVDTPSELSINSAPSAIQVGRPHNRNSKGSISGSTVSTASVGLSIASDCNKIKRPCSSKPINWRQTHRKLLQQRDDNAAKLRQTSSANSQNKGSDGHIVETIYVNKPGQNKKSYGTLDIDSSTLSLDYRPVYSSTSNNGSTSGALPRPLLNAWTSPRVSQGNSNIQDNGSHPQHGVYTKLQIQSKYPFSHNSSGFSYSSQLPTNHNKSWSKYG